MTKNIQGTRFTVKRKGKNQEDESLKSKQSFDRNMGNFGLQERDSLGKHDF
jgi:hypothetical protein